MFCAKCGREIKASQKFCDGCGAPNMGYKEPSEMTQIVNAAVAGDNSAIEKIYNMTYRQGYSVALQIVKNEQDAMDILQEAYISALRNLSSLQNPDKLRSWFNQIVSNRCKDWLKKKKPQLFTDMTPDDSDEEFEDTLKNENITFSPEESVDYTETKRLMQEILDGLPEDQKLCVLMYYYEELSIAEIAETLECSTGTVKSRLNYARKKIKTDVQELEKKGTKLYNIAPLPFILWMLRTNESSVSLPVEFAGKITANVAGQVAEEVTKNIAGQTIESGIQAATGTGAGQSVAFAGTQAVAKTAASAGAKHLAVKIIAGVVAASFIGGGGYMVYKKSNPTGVVDSVKKQKEKPTKKELNTLMEKIDYDYLRAMCIYLPEYDSADDLSENNRAGIYLMAMARNFDLNYGDKYHSDDIHEEDFPLSESQIIPEDQIVSEDNQQASFKKGSFDKFNTIAGITKDPTKVDFSTVDRHDLNGIKYDGENFTGHFDSTMDNRISSRIVGKQIDEKSGAVLVSVEILELNTNGSGEENRTQETVTIVPSDNKYGYQIKKIKDDYTKEVNKVEPLIESIEENSGKIVELAQILGDFSSDNLNVEDAKAKIAYQAAGLYLTNGNEGLLRAEDEIGAPEDGYYESDDREFNVERYKEACQLAGISSQDYEAGVMNDQTTVTSATYKVKYDYNQMHSNTNSYFLRTEIDPVKEEVYLYYLSRDDDQAGTVSNFKKGTVVLVPSDNSFGYEMKEVKTEEWNDDYTEELKQMGTTVYGLMDYGDSGVASEIMGAIYKEVDYKISEMEKKASQVEEKYPDYKKLIEEDQTKYWDDAEQSIQGKKRNNMGNSLMSPGRVDATQETRLAAEARIYYLIGNFLMDDTVGKDVLVKMEFDTGTSEESIGSGEETEWEVSDDIKNEVANVIGSMIRGKKNADGGDFSVFGSYDINVFSNDEFINCVQSFITYSTYAAEDKEELTNENGVYDGCEISLDSFTSICKDTLGRTNGYDMSSQIDGNKVHLYGREFAVSYEPTVTSILHDSDGNVRVVGTILDATSAEMKEYQFTATGYESDDSKIGMVINQMEISE